MISTKDLRYMAGCWAEWVENSCKGLGYASETSISKLTTSPGRSTKQNYTPIYEPDPVARRFDDALRKIPDKQQNLIYCRLILGMSDARLMEYDTTFRTPGQAKWAVYKAFKAVGRVL